MGKDRLPDLSDVWHLAEEEGFNRVVVTLSDSSSCASLPLSVREERGLGPTTSEVRREIASKGGRSMVIPVDSEPGTPSRDYVISKSKK